MATVHVYPVGDFVDHDTETEECVCIPDVEHVVCKDGSDGWVYMHHSLDGRELKEPQHG